ncbi:MAG: rhodanese-like domain-containing protein [Alphaproteobacteria bacterium]|nr:rhodanese-like domain-containing protein [Alphaproteobacteria bacterium]
MADHAPLPAALLAQARPHPAGFADLPVAAAAAHLAAFRVVDVREPSEFTGPLGHVDGAELLPLSTVPDLAEELAAETRPVLLVCRSGGRSAHAAAYLAQEGGTDLFNLAGGMLAWNEAGLPVVHGA